MFNTIALSSDQRRLFLIDDNQLHVFSLETGNGVIIGLLSNQLTIASPSSEDMLIFQDQTKVELDSSALQCQLIYLPIEKKLAISSIQKASTTMMAMARNVGSDDVNPTLDSHVGSDDVNPTLSRNVGSDDVNPTLDSHVGSDDVNPTLSRNVGSDDVNPTLDSHVGSDDVNPTLSRNVGSDDVNPTLGSHVGSDDVNPTLLLAPNDQGKINLLLNNVHIQVVDTNIVIRVIKKQR